jgi:preprotein translocase subunit SecE
MGKEKAATMGSFLQELFQAGVYKRSQGRITRQVTFAVLAIVFALAAWRMYNFWNTFPDWWHDMFGRPGQYALPSMILLFGLWFSYRIVNYPRFADFLIAVEAEMNKVSWPTRSELFRSALVVIFVIVAMATVLFFYDVVWQMMFEFLGVLRKA